MSEATHVSATTYSDVASGLLSNPSEAPSYRVIDPALTRADFVAQVISKPLEQQAGLLAGTLYDLSEKVDNVGEHMGRIGERMGRIEHRMETLENLLRGFIGEVREGRVNI